MNFTKTIALICCCFLLGCSPKMNTQATPKALSGKKPNLLLIITDEHSFRTLGCYRELMSYEQGHIWGDVVVETPNLDYLAHNGAILTSMYASTPSCTPSRSSMFTGNYPQTNKTPKNGTYLSAKIPTIGTVLTENGYMTGYAGKVHLLGHPKPNWEPDYNFGFEDHRFMFNGGHWKKFGLTEDGKPFVATKNPKNGKLNTRVEKADEKSYATDFLTDRALEFLEKNKENPFAYVLSLPDPHTPNTVRAPYDTMYTKYEFKLPKTFRRQDFEGDPSWRKTDLGPTKYKPKRNFTNKKILSYIPQYYGMVKCIDDNIGRLIAKLKADGNLENTIIAFSSDHGDLMGEHGRLNKGTPHETSAKIPFIVFYPNGIPPKTIVNQAANTTDWMDTFLKLMKISNHDPNTTEGRDLTPWLLKNEQAASELEDITFVRFLFWVAAVTDRYKLIFEKSDTKPWLIDLEKDPDENTNFIDSPEHREVVKSLAKKLKAYGVEYNDDTVLNKKIQQQLDELING